MYIVFTRVLPLILTFHTIVVQMQLFAPKGTQDLKNLDWTAWCKFQPNRFDCGKPDQPRFYYDIKLEDCKAFSYGGCPTSYNNFYTLSACHEACRDDGAYKVPVNLTDNVSCRLQPDFGDCNDYHPMFYFDVNLRTCKGFSYSGCGGNYNRFPNSQICGTVCNALTSV